MAEVTSQAMKSFASFSTEHGDIVHDVAGDYYGERLATCCADGQIKVWDKRSDNSWRCTSSWQAHKGPVNKLSWAHPEFGHIIASCSTDHKVCIWTETEEFVGGDADEKWRPKWALRADLVDARENVTDIEFAPRHIGLQLAACSSAGMLVLYEATDLMTLSNWQVLRDLDAFPKTAGCNCLSWNPSQFDKAMIAVGSNDTTVKVFEWAGDHTRKWDHVCSLVGNTAPVLDVAWAPNVGRSYHLIATASKDGAVIIWQLTFNERGKQANILAKFDLHQAEVWRVEWNVTGTILSSSGDDGTVRLWKANARNVWEPLCVVQNTPE